MKKVLFLCGLMASSAINLHARKENCLLRTILLTARSIQNTSSEILGKVCTIKDITIEILEKVCNMSGTSTAILEKVCDIEITTSEILEDVVAGFACNATAISMSTTITEPGPYCLSQSITGDITVATNRVQLDLNGHTLFGIVIMDGQEDVTVGNGFISSASPGGVMIANSTKVEVSNILFSTSDIGVSVASSDNVVITDCMFQGQASFAVTTTLSSNITLQNLNATQCGGTAFSIVDGNTIILTDCTATENTVSGFLMNTVENAQLTNCIARNNSGLAGFLMNIVEGVQLINCIANNNGFSGFRFEGYLNIQLVQCVSREQIGGFDFLLAGSGIMCKECIAENNSSSGFSIFEGSNIEILDSLSLDNGSLGFFIIGEDLALTNCVSRRNSSDGFRIFNTIGGTLGTRVLKGCVASSNGGTGFAIFASSTVSVTVVMKDCDAIDNGTTAGIRIANAGAGTPALLCTIDSCSALRNTGDGILTFSGGGVVLFDINSCLTTENSGTGIAQTGGFTFGSITGNRSTDNAVGISKIVSDADVTVLNNFCVNNTTNYSGVLGTTITVATTVTDTIGVFWSNISG